MESAGITMFDTSYRAKQIAETLLELRRNKEHRGAYQHLFELRHWWGWKDTLQEGEK